MHFPCETWPELADESPKQPNLVELMMIVVVAVMVLLLIVVVMMVVVPGYYRTTLKLYRGRYTFCTVRTVEDTVEYCQYWRVPSG